MENFNFLTLFNGMAPAKNVGKDILNLVKGVILLENFVFAALCLAVCHWSRCKNVVSATSWPYRAAPRFDVNRINRGKKRQI